MRNNFTLDCQPLGVSFHGFLKYVVMAISNSGTQRVIGAFEELGDALECAHANTGRIGIAHAQVFTETGQIYGESRRECM